MKLDRLKLDIALANSGMTGYREVAERMGCSRQNLMLILGRGSCNPTNAGKIARALGVPVESILKKED